MEWLFCPYLSGQKIADVPQRAVWGMSGPDRQERYGARSAYEGISVRTCQSKELPMGLRGPCGACRGRIDERGTEPEGPTRAFLSVPVRGLQDGNEEKIAGRLNELATGEYFCGISNEELMQLFF